MSEHERLTHYVLADQLDLSRASGQPTVALCGKQWVPDGDPDRYPLCPQCSFVANSEFDSDSPMDAFERDFWNQPQGDAS